MSKEHDDIEDLFSDFEDENPGNSDGLDIIGSERRTERTAPDPSQAYDQGEEYLEDDFFEEEEPYYDDAPDYDKRYGNSDPERDSEILSRMNRTKKPSGMKPLLLIVVIAVVVIVVLLIAKLGGGRQQQPENTPAPPPEETASALVEEEADSEIQTVIQTYLNARIHNDMDTLATVVDDVSALPANDSTSAFFESYQNIHVYTVPGIQEGEYVAYVRSDVNLTNYDTDLPDLQFFYIRTAEDGSRYIATSYTEEESNYIDQVIHTDEVQGLINEVWGILDGIADSDTDLAALISMLYGNDAGQQPAETPAAETPAAETPAAESQENTENTDNSENTADSPSAYEMEEVNDTVTINDTVNIRATPSTEAEILGVIPVGTTVDRSHHGARWSYVTYEGVSGFVLSEYVDEN